MRIPPLARRLVVITVLLGALSGFVRPAGGIGGTGAPQGGIGGTGITAIGVIQRFGSIYVNGREYLLSPHTHYWVDGRRMGVKALRRGQDVFVVASAQGRGRIARTVRVQHALIGVVQKVQASGRRLRILGQEITLSAAASARLQRGPQGAPRAGMDLAISAGSPAPGTWVATRAHVVRPTPGHPLPFLIRGILHMVARHALALGHRLFVWNGAVVPKALVGHYVVARGYYRLGHPAVISVRAATGLQAAKGRIVLTGYLRAGRHGWRFEGQALARGHTSLAISQHRPMFLAIRRSTPDRFVILRGTPHVHMMSYGLHPDRGARAYQPARPVIAHPVPTHPEVIRPQIARPQISRPQVVRPTITRPHMAPLPSPSLPLSLPPLLH